MYSLPQFLHDFLFTDLVFFTTASAPFTTRDTKSRESIISLTSRSYNSQHSKSNAGTEIQIHINTNWLHNGHCFIGVL